MKVTCNNPYQDCKLWRKSYRTVLQQFFFLLTHLLLCNYCKSQLVNIHRRINHDKVILTQNVLNAFILETFADKPSLLPYLCRSRNFVLSLRSHLILCVMLILFVPHNAIIITIPVSILILSTLPTA